MDMSIIIQRIPAFIPWNTVIQVKIICCITIGMIFCPKIIVS